MACIMMIMRGGELDYLVASTFFKQYLQKFSLNISLINRMLMLRHRIKRLPIQLLINLIPSKATRKKLRKKYL